MTAREETEGLNTTHDEDSTQISELPQPNSSDENDAERQIFLASATDDLAVESAAGRPPDDEAQRDGVSPKHVTLEELERREPPDRFHLVYIIMVVHGVGLLMPWNMFITAKSYFEDHKLYQGNQTTPQVLEYRTNFMAYVGMASQFPGATMNLVNLFVQCGGKPAIRIVGSIVIIIVVFVVTLVLAMVDSSQWPELFFWITMFSAVIINSAVGVYQNSLYGVVAMLPMKYTNSVIFGNNVAGTFVSVLNIVMLAVTPNIRTSAMYYFLTAVIILLIAMDCYFLLPHTKFFRHYQQVMKLKQEQRQRSRPQQQTCTVRLTSYWHVFKQIWVLAVCVWFVFFVSLALFPQIQSDIKRRSFPMDDLYWTPVFCYLNFNLFAMLGNLLTEVQRFPGPRWLWIPVLLRVVFIPLYLMFNFRPDTRSWAAPIANDYVYLVCSVLMAFSGGYLSSLCMMYAPVQVEGHDAGTAGMMMSFFLVLGILTGVNASRLLASLV